MSKKWKKSLLTVYMRWLICVCLLCFFPVNNLTAQLTKAGKIRAAYVYKFSKFIDWQRKDVNSGLVFGVVGTGSSQNSLDVLKVLTFRGKRIILRKGRNLKEVGDCHIIFFAQPEIRGLEKMLLELSDKECLTVGVDEDFIELGGIVSFYLRDNKVRFKINPEAAESAGLKINSALLKLGK